MPSILILCICSSTFYRLECWLQEMVYILYYMLTTLWGVIVMVLGSYLVTLETLWEHFCWIFECFDPMGRQNEPKGSPGTDCNCSRSPKGGHFGCQKWYKIDCTNMNFLSCLRVGQEQNCRMMRHADPQALKQLIRTSHKYLRRFAQCRRPLILCVCSSTFYRFQCWLQ